MNSEHIRYIYVYHEWKDYKVKKIVETTFSDQISRQNRNEMLAICSGSCRVDWWQAIEVENLFDILAFEGQ